MLTPIPNHRCRRGFTYVEVGMVIAILVVMAAMIVPAVVRSQTAQKRRLFRQDLLSLMTEARAKALASGSTVSVTYDKEENVLKAVAEGTNGQTQEVRTIAIPQDLHAAKFSADKYESPPDGLRLPFYLDGTTTGGGVEFDAAEGYAGDPFSLIVGRSDARARIIDGPLPDMASDRWKAGTYETRA